MNAKYFIVAVNGDGTNIHVTPRQVATWMWGKRFDEHVLLKRVESLTTIISWQLVCPTGNITEIADYFSQHGE